MKILFTLNGSTGNRGCEAILLSTYDILKTVFPDARFVNSSAKDERISNTAYLSLPDLKHACHPEFYSMPGIRWQIAKRIQRHHFNFERFLPWADAVFSLGGDNYSLDYPNAHWYFEANERILKAGKKLVIWGASIGPFDKDKALERYAARHLKKTHRIVVRETHSEQYLATLGIRENVTLLPDPAFSLHPEEVQLPRRLEEMLEAGAIGMNLSPLLARYRPNPEDWTEEATRWVEAVLEATGSPLLLVPHVMQRGNDDLAFMADISRRIRSVGGDRLQLLSGYALSSRQLKYVIGRLRCFVGARTHATIAALSQSVPTLSIGYSMKARGINEDIFGDDRWVVNHLDLDSKKLTELIEQLLNEEDRVRAMLESWNHAFGVNQDIIKKVLA